MEVIWPNQTYMLASFVRNFSWKQTTISYVNSSIKLNFNQSANDNLKPWKRCVLWIYVMLFQSSDTFHNEFVPNVLMYNSEQIPYLLLIRRLCVWLINYLRKLTNRLRYWYTLCVVVEWRAYRQRKSIFCGRWFSFIVIPPNSQQHIKLYTLYFVLLLF
jgi:hypothetical protein